MSSSATTTPHRQMQQHQQQQQQQGQLVPPTSREALLSWGRSLVSSNRMHQPTPTGRLAVASPYSQQQPQPQQNTPNGAANTPQQPVPPPNRPALIGGTSVASATAQALAVGAPPPPRTTSGMNSTRQDFSALIAQSGPSSSSSSGGGHNNNTGSFNQRARALTTVVGPGTPQQQQQQSLNNHAADGLLPPGQSPSASRYNSFASNRQPSSRNVPAGASSAAANASASAGAAAAGRSGSSDAFFDELMTGRKSSGVAPGAAPDTPLHRLAAMSDQELLAPALSGGGGGGGAPLSRQSSAASSTAGSGAGGLTRLQSQLQQPAAANSSDGYAMTAPSGDDARRSGNNGGGAAGGSAAAQQLQLNAQSRRAILDDHRGYINHLKAMQESNDERFRLRERELTQILERLVDAETGIADAIRSRSQAAAVHEADAMRRSRGEAAMAIAADGGGGSSGALALLSQRVFDGTDAAALERDIEEAKAEVAEWEQEEALCGAAVAQLAASIAEMEQHASDALRIFCEGAAAAMRLGEAAALDAREAVAFTPNSVMLGETAAANRQRLHSIVAANIDRAQHSGSRVKVGLSAIERRSAAARAAAAQVGLDSADNGNGSDERAGSAADSQIHASGVAGLEVLAAINGPSLALNDYVSQVQDALRAAHDMQMLIVHDLREALDECTIELRRTGAIVDDAHEALQELVAQVDRARDDAAEAASQEQAMAAERSDVARQVRAIETAADDQRRRVAAETNAVAQARRDADKLAAQLADNEARAASLREREKEFDAERAQCEERLRLTQKEEQAASDVVQQLQQQTTLARGQCDAAKRRAEKAADARDDHANELASLEEQHSTLEGQVKQMRVAIRTSRQAVSEKGKSNAEHERRVQALSIDFETALAAANTAEREAIMAAERLDKAREELRVLTMEEADLRAQINAVNDALLVETSRVKEREAFDREQREQREHLQAAVQQAQAQSASQQQADARSGSSFVLTGRGALERPTASRSSTPMHPDNDPMQASNRSGGGVGVGAGAPAGNSRRGSVVNMVDVPVAAGASKRSGSSVIATSAVELDPHHHHPLSVSQQSLPSTPSAHGATPVAQQPPQQHSRVFLSAAPNAAAAGGGAPPSERSGSNIVLGESAKPFRMFSVSPDRAPVLVSMDTRHYGKKHFGPGVAAALPSGSLLSQMRDRSVTPSTASQLVGGGSRRPSSPGRSMFLGPSSQTHSFSAAAAGDDGGSFSPNSALHRREAAEALFQQPEREVPSVAALRNQVAGPNSQVQQQQQRRQQLEPAAHPSALQHPVFQQQQPQQNPPQRSGSASGINEVQARLDTILKRKEQRERAAAAAGGL